MATPAPAGPRDAVDDTARAALHDLARRSLEAASTGGRLEVPPLAGILAEPRACFVSLHTDEGALRGCIGTLRPLEPLGAAVIQMAEAASQRDPRFPPVRPEELSGIQVEISVLSPFVELEDPRAVEVGVHGLQVEGRGRSGLLLPQVATQYGWTRAEFLDHTCEKAGLPPGSWQDEDVTVRSFRAEVF